jgi:CubicO group peptidase (beta-lactamase class C family)
MFLFILSAGLFAASYAQQSGISFPQTQAEKKVEAYIKAFNAGEAAIREFFAAHTAKDALQRIPLETRLARYRQMRDRLGLLEIRKVVETRNDYTSIVARGSNGPVVQMEFDFEPAEPFGLISIRVKDAGEELPPANPKKDNRELIAAIKDYAQKISGTDEFSGVILVAQNGKPLFAEAYGYADREKKIPNRVDTKFNIGSINKSFTSLAVRQLIEQKKIALSDPIKNYLPDYPNSDAAAKVTVRHLLEMTSGIGDFFGNRYESTPKEKIRVLADYLPLFADKQLEFEPGTKNQYSNGGYIVLGLIIEKASGEDYYAYVREHIYKPAGMLDSDWYDKDSNVPNRALGYTRDGSTLKSNYPTLPGRGSSAGGGYSTAGDLLKYTIALNEGKFGGTGEDMQGGFGIAGGAPGINAALDWDQKSACTIVVLSNFDPPSAARVARQIHSWLPR